MPRARKTLISLDDTPYYHCVCRCVRRAFLWGIDEFSGKDYSHRKQWVVDRLSLLTQVFAIDVCAYAVMSNHYHLVLHIDKPRSQLWTEDEVITRWTTLFSLPIIVQRYQHGESVSQAERDKALEIIQSWRQRLHDISWFMRCLNEHLAREANHEDQCRGRFWEGRFHSQALLDDAGVLTCMAYVDLNPLRAGIATTPENSEHTSIQQRIRALQKNQPTPPQLKAFRQPSQNDSATTLPFALSDYLQLVEWSGRTLGQNKRGHIHHSLPDILIRLNIDPDYWKQMMQPHGNFFKQVVGRAESIKHYAQRHQQAWCQGMQHSLALFSS